MKAPLIQSGVDGGSTAQDNQTQFLLWTDILPALLSQPKHFEEVEGIRRHHCPRVRVPTMLQPQRRLADQRAGMSWFIVGQASEDFDYIVYFQDDRSQGTKSGSNSERKSRELLLKLCSKVEQISFISRLPRV